MKYVITIPQAAAVLGGFKIDLASAALMDFIVHFYASGACMKKVVDGKEYFWISYELLTEQLPMLEIRTRKGWWQKIKRLEEAGLLVICPDNVRNKRTFLGFGPRYDEYWQASALPSGNGKRYQTETLSVTEWKRNKYKNEKDKNDNGGIKSHLDDATVLPPPPRRGSEKEVGLYVRNENSEDVRQEDGPPQVVNTSALEAKAQPEKKRGGRANLSLLEDVRDYLDPYGQEVVAFFEASKELWADWLAYRSEIRRPYKSARLFALLIAKSCRDAAGDLEAVRAAIERSRASLWQGLFVRHLRAKNALGAAPHSLQAAPAGEPTPTRLYEELKAFYTSNPQCLEELKSATPSARMNYRPLMEAFCADRVRAGFFADTFSQHHAALILFAKRCLSKKEFILERIRVNEKTEQAAPPRIVRGRNPVQL